MRASVVFREVRGTDVSSGLLEAVLGAVRNSGHARSKSQGKKRLDSVVLRVRDEQGFGEVSTDHKLSTDRKVSASMKGLRGYTYRQKFLSSRPFRPSALIVTSRAKDAPSKKREKGWDVLTPAPVRVIPLDANQSDLSVRVPQLRHGLHNVLRTQGVVPFVEMGNGRLNFSSKLQKIVQPDEFRSDASLTFVPASKDTQLIQRARILRGENKRRVKFIASTSGMTEPLSFIYHVISNFRPPSFDGLSTNFSDKELTFGPFSYAPVTFTIHPKDEMSGTCVVDKTGKPEMRGTILLELGGWLEQCFTLESDAFDSLRTASKIQKIKKRPNQIYNHSIAGDFLVRSQIDCHEMRNKKREFFEIKTRAVLPIRQDVGGYKNWLDYKIDRVKGGLNSYEREFFDMIRNSFLKYSLQIRLGRMKGAFFSYHNTVQIFGFEYVSLEEMEKYVYGSSYWADIAFDMCLKLHAKILSKMTEEFGEDRQECIRLLYCFRKNGMMCLYAYKLPNNVPLSHFDKDGVMVSTESVEKDPSRIGLDVNNLRRFSVSVKPYVNGKLFTDMVKMSPGDDFQLDVQIKREKAVDVGAFVSNLRKAEELTTFGSAPKRRLAFRGSGKGDLERHSVEFPPKRHTKKISLSRNSKKTPKSPKQTSELVRIIAKALQ